MKIKNKKGIWYNKCKLKELPDSRMKKPSQLERYFKGVANHRRISILLLIDKNPGLSVEEIRDELNGNFKTISQHTRVLVRAGFLNKKYQGRRVIHFLSPYGKKFVEFIKNFE
jgi:DNA-binding MarR family transcriptional regulator